MAGVSGWIIERKQATRSIFTCRMCNVFSTMTLTHYDFIGAVHSHYANFRITCGVSGCVRTYQNYHSFQKHLLRAHCETVDNTNEEFIPGMEDHESYDVPIDAASHEPLFDPKRATALFLLKAQEIQKVSQVKLDVFCFSVFNRTSAAKIYSCL